MSNSKINSWDWDIRVRERNLKNGTLTDKDVEAKDAKLVDLADQTDAVTEIQPAIGNGEGDDDDDDVDDEAAGEPS